ARRPAPTGTGRWRWSLSAVPEKRRGLGRGLELLVGGPGDPELAHLPVETIHAHPRQPRKRFDGEATSALADSIRAQGLVQPVVVRPREAGRYELIAGQRRWRGERSEGHARAVLAVPEQDGRRRLARQVIRRGMSVRAAERAARWAGARTKPRKVPKCDPALLERVRSAAERLTGFPARIVSGRLEIAFTDETELAELAEALEAPAVSLGGSEALTP